MPLHPPVKAVVFDLGNVLLHFDFGIAARAMATHAAVDARAIQEALDQSDLLHAFETGHLDRSAFFREVSKRIHYRANQTTFEAAFANIFSPILPMIRLHADLVAHTIPTYLFSNTNIIAAEFVREHFGFFSTFQGHCLSFEHGSMKPEPTLYRIVEAMAHVPVEHLLFLDDRPENVDTAQKRGWQALCHQSAEASIPEVRQRCGLQP